MNLLNYDSSNSETALVADSGMVVLRDPERVTQPATFTKAEDFHFLSKASQDDLDLIDKINSSNWKVTAIAVMTAKKKHKEVLHTCKTHHGLHIARADNLLCGRGCALCGTHGEKGLSDRDFAIKRIPLEVKPYLVSLQITKKSADRSKLHIDLITKYFRYQGLLKNMSSASSNLMKKTAMVISRHGEWVTIFTNLSNGKCEISALCTLSKMRSGTWSVLTRDWAPRTDPAVRSRIVEKSTKLAEQHSDSLFKLKPSESKPAHLVRQLIAKHGGQCLPKAEVMFAGLDGDQRQLRCDLFYERWKCVVEVQSVLHEKSIAGRGGDAAFRLRVDYDERKRRYFEEDKHSTGITFFAIKGDAHPAVVEKQIVNMLRQLGVLVQTEEDHSMTPPEEDEAAQEEPVS
jgi:hypothetical protein